MSVLLLFVVVVYIAVIMIVLILVTTVKGIVETTRTTIGTLTSNKLVATMLGHHRQDVSECHGTSISHVQVYPSRWGTPPAVQTKDIVELPHDYGYGSSTLREWITRCMSLDTHMLVISTRLTNNMIQRNLVEWKIAPGFSVHTIYNMFVYHYSPDIIKPEKIHMVSDTDVVVTSDYDLDRVRLYYDPTTGTVQSPVKLG
jgi:hypothetical protein